ncbi:MAG TPA: hypothetical protein VG015_04175 [Candidatus Dormibacteraeota bacterium]|nr:hypothetical protein [Candidatus Dormibacteraeota bacterium]
MRLNWTKTGLDDLEELVERAPVQGLKVYEMAVWLARQRFPNLGRYVPEMGCRYWTVGDQGLFYKVDRGKLLVVRVHDLRRRRKAWE